MCTSSPARRPRRWRPSPSRNRNHPSGARLSRRRPGGAWYAIAATDDPSVNAAIVAEAERRHVFCVRADAGRDGTAVTPASFDYEGLSFGVLASGEHRRSAAVRSAIREAFQQGRIAPDVVASSASDVVPGGWLWSAAVPATRN